MTAEQGRTDDACLHENVALLDSLGQHKVRHAKHVAVIPTPCNITLLVLH